MIIFTLSPLPENTLLYRAMLVAIVPGALRKGPLSYGLRSSREIKTQNASCQMGGREVTR